MTRRLAPLVLAALALAPRAASALVSVDAFYGLTRPPSASFSTAVAGAQNNPDLIASSLQIAGGDALLHLGTLELGAIVDTSFKSGSASQTAVGALAGVGFDLLKAVRLEALGEIGGQRYGDFLKNPSIVSASSKSEWLMYVGLRPGIAYRFDVGPAGFMLGLWGFVRWDLTTSNVPVTVASASGTSPGSVKLGGATIGAVARVGLDF
jgi:hypothetical protein